MDIQNEVKAVEAEVVAKAEEVKEVVINEAEKVKAAILAQEASFKTQLDQVRKDMVALQQQFDNKKTLALKLEGAIESIGLTLQNFTK